jgi:hypothetical protein
MFVKAEPRFRGADYTIQPKSGYNCRLSTRLSRISRAEVK